MSVSSFGKPLKGSALISARISKPIEDSITNSLSGGSVPLGDVNITGGVIDGVIIGSNVYGPGSFTTLTSGTPSGNGFNVCFYGNIVGDSACWVPTTGTWNIQGDLLVRDITDLGNLRFSINNISATNTNGSINLIPNGSGNVNVNGGLIQSSANGNISLFSVNGNFISSTNRSTFTARNGGIFTTDNGSLTFRTGTSIVNRVITFITTGSQPIISTSVAHGYQVGDTVRISSTNSTPVLTGDYLIDLVPSTTSFRISGSPMITSVGTSGNARRVNNINLSAGDTVIIPQDIPLQFGPASCNHIRNVSSDIEISSCNSIKLLGEKVFIPVDKPLEFGDIGKSIVSNGVDLTLNSDGKVIIDSDLQVNGQTTYVQSNIVQINDPVFTVGTNSIVSDPKFRGIEYKYHTGISQKTGFFGRNTATNCFTYIPDAVNTDEVFTGNPGCAVFGGVTASSLNLQGGAVEGVGTINACNLNCLSNMTISSSGTTSMSSTAMTISSGSLTTNTNIIGINGATGATQDKGISFNIASGNTGFMGYNTSSSCFTFLTNTTITGSEVTTSTPGNMCLGPTNITGDLTVSGFAKNLLKTEHLTSATTVSPSNLINITWIYVTAPSGIVTGTLTAASEDGFQKHIFLGSTTGGVYQLFCPSGLLLDPGSGTTAAKTLRFETPGQSIYLLWNATLQSYLIVNAGVCVS
jgi:hypothetical protein